MGRQARQGPHPPPTEGPAPLLVPDMTKALSAVSAVLHLCAGRLSVAWAAERQAGAVAR